MDTAFINQHLPNSRALLASVVDIIKKRFDYDFIIIDCCPSLGILNMNALNASDYLIIPTSMDYFAINGVKQTISRLEDIKKFTPNFKIIGVLKQMFQSKRMVDTAISGILENDFDIDDIGYIFETPIPDSIEARKSSIEGRLLSQKPKDKAAIAYRKVTQELLKRIACLESEEE